MQFSGVTMTGGFNVAPLSAPVVPTDPYWANVSFLSETVSTNGQTNNVFLDSSTNTLTMTRSGTPTQGSYSPFPANSTTSYSPTTNGGSGFFNGTTDYLTTPAAQIFNFGTGDFTIEGWFNFSSFAGYPIPLSFAVGTASTRGWYVVIYPDGLPRFSYSSDGTNLIAMVSNTAATINTWNHIAVTRSAGTSFLFLNGQQVATVNTQSGAMYYNASAVFSVGREAGFSTSYVPGYISSARVVKGTAVYTSTFTPPTTPLTAISGTSLLLNFTNAGMYDAAAKNNMTSVGSAQASTTQAKWSPTSLKLSGGTDALTMPSSSNFNFGSDDFTIEAWIYVSSYVSNSAVISKGAFGPFLIFIGSSSEIAFYSSTNGSSWAVTDLRFATAPATNTWHYIAVTRSGTTVRTFFNGTLANSTTLTGAVVSNATDISVGRYSSSFNGYIQDLRVTKGVARYTATFTPPTAALPTSA
jgi:hypothetical protein